MTSNSDLRKKVMRRVRFVYAVRPFLSNAAGAVLLLGVSLYLLGREVFVAQIFRNMPAADVAALFRFVEAAFLNTSFVVQVLTVASFMGGLWLVRECIRLVMRLEARQLV